MSALTRILTVVNNIYGKVDTELATVDTVVDGIATEVAKILTPVTVTGNADIDISAGDYVAGYVPLLGIVPAAGAPIVDLVIDLDYVKATTGVSVVATAADTMDVIVKSKIDGTNYRVIQKATQRSLTGDQTLELSGERFHIGAVGEDEAIQIAVKLSAERADAEIPYAVTYIASAAPTVTPVAAG